jgi:hypothetical protein
MAAEMHSSFTGLRGGATPMNLRGRFIGLVPTEAVLKDLARIETLWGMAAPGRGPWLFGEYSLADAFFAPVAARIAAYDLPVGPRAAGIHRGASGASGVPGMAGSGARGPAAGRGGRGRPADGALAGLNPKPGQGFFGGR